MINYDSKTVNSIILYYTSIIIQYQILIKYIPKCYDDYQDYALWAKGQMACHYHVN